MVKFTRSLGFFLSNRYPKEFVLIGFGHLELFTDEMKREYLDWCITDEGRRYLNESGEVSNE